MFYLNGEPEPFALRFVGKPWQSAWVRVKVLDEHIELSLSQHREMGTFIGVLSGDRPLFKLTFDHNGFTRSYFKVFDPYTDVCVGKARCLKDTGTKILQVLVGNRRHNPSS